jgi:hypothetical protein
MFKIIGGVVVGGLALLGVAKLLEQEKRIVVTLLPPPSNATAMVVPDVSETVEDPGMTEAIVGRLAEAIRSMEAGKM